MANRGSATRCRTDHIRPRIRSRLVGSQSGRGSGQSRRISGSPTASGIGVGKWAADNDSTLGQRICGHLASPCEAAAAGLGSAAEPRFGPGLANRDRNPPRDIDPGAVPLSAHGRALLPIRARTATNSRRPALDDPDPDPAGAPEGRDVRAGPPAGRRSSPISQPFDGRSRCSRAASSKVTSADVAAAMEAAASTALSSQKPSLPHVAVGAGLFESLGATT